MAIRILLVDDEPAMRRMLAFLLESQGYRVYEAANGAEALGLYSEIKPSLVVLDHHMPEMTGLEFLKKLRQDQHADVPVLMMSGDSEKLIQDECYSLGVYDFIRKPEKNEVILSRVNNGIQIAELLHFRKQTEFELRLSAAALARLESPRIVEAETFSMYSFSQPFSAIGGDICTVCAADTPRPLFFVGDITGHGVSAALFSVFVNIAVQRAAAELTAPVEILHRLNRDFAAVFPSGHFVSMFCCVYDTADRKLLYANAGHPPPLIYSSGVAQRLVAGKGALLGVSVEAKFSQDELAFRTGDRLLLCTDGIFELHRDDGFFTDNAVERLAGEAAEPRAAFEAICAHLHQQKGVADDRTVMLIAANS